MYMNTLSKYRSEQFKNSNIDDGKVIISKIIESHLVDEMMYEGKRQVLC